MIVALAWCSVSLFLGDPSPFHEIVEKRLQSHFEGEWRGKKVADFLKAVGFPPGNYATTKELPGVEPLAFLRPGAGLHEWRTNWYRFAVEYGPDDLVVRTEVRITTPPPIPIGGPP
jgi:hypothetical protein